MRAAEPAPEDLTRATRNAAAVLLEVVCDLGAHPVDRLECAAVLGEFVDNAAALAMADAREVGLTWRAIGEHYGMSHVGARKRYLGMGEPEPSLGWAGGI